MSGTQAFEDMVETDTAVDSLETFFEYVFHDTRLVSEYEDEYSLAGRADEFDDYVDEYNRYQALATGQGELQEGDELFVTDGEFNQRLL